MRTDSEGKIDTPCMKVINGVIMLLDPILCLIPNVFNKIKVRGVSRPLNSRYITSAEVIPSLFRSMAACVILYLNETVLRVYLDEHLNIIMDNGVIFV